MIWTEQQARAADDVTLRRHVMCGNLRVFLYIHSMVTQNDQFIQLTMDVLYYKIYFMILTQYFSLVSYERKKKLCSLLALQILRSKDLDRSGGFCMMHNSIVTVTLLNVTF